MTKKDLEHSLIELAKKIEVYRDKVTCEVYSNLFNIK